MLQTFITASSFKPHIHSLLWLNDENGEKAPSFWSKSKKDDSDLPEDLKEMLEKSFDSSISSDSDQPYTNDDL